MNINIFRQGYEKPLHYPCTIMAKAKPNKSIDKRLYCDIFSIYFKREKEWDMSILKDNIEWWCYATDLERHIKQSQKDLEIATKALKDINNIVEDVEAYYGGVSVNYRKMVEDMKNSAQTALKQLNQDHKE